MTWLVWRQYRAQGAIASVLLAVAAAVILVSGFADGVALALHARHLRGKQRSAWNSSRWWATAVVSDLPYISLIVPVVLGMLPGAPLVAHELETRTSDFAWAQSVTRARWLIVKTGWLLLAAAACGGVLAALTTWWYGPINALAGPAYSHPASSTPRASCPSGTRCSPWPSASPRAPWRGGPCPR